MQFKDMKISTQLRISIGATILIVVCLGFLAWLQTNTLWQNTRWIYDHPLQVNRAIGVLETDIMGMRMEIRHAMLTNNLKSFQTARKRSAIHQANAERQIDLLFERYLGPRSDIEDIQNSIKGWVSTRESNWVLLHEGKVDIALSRIFDEGDLGAQRALLVKQIQKIDDFAKTKADTLYLDATQLKTALNMQLIFIIGFIILLTSGIGYLMILGIKKPLKELTAVTEGFRKGDYNARSQYLSTNELGLLSASFNQMAQAISLRMETDKKGSAMAEALIIETKLKEFAETVLEKFMDITESHMGAFYSGNENDNSFSPLAAIGVNPELLEPFDASAYEGEFGKALKTGKLSHIRDIHENTLFKLKTFAGTAIPREIITLPIVVEGEVRGMLCLACLNSFSTAALTALTKSSIIALNTAFSNLLSNDRTRRLSEKLRENNQELTAQQEELKAQAQELQKQSEALQAQNIELAEQRLAVEEASRLKSQFLSNMSHELRTPLNSVMALSRVLMMQAKTKLNDEEISYLEIIERNGKNLLNLINNILDLSKIEAGKMDIQPRPFSLGQTLDNILESIAPLAEEKHIQILKKNPKTLPLLESDEIRVSQILQNLVANAVKFTASGSVSVTVKTGQEKIHIQVTDTGIGIAEQDLPHIFDEFRQVDGSSSRRHEGTGLGLTIAHKAARMLGGDIFVTSTLGMGTTFILTLPLTWQGQKTLQQTIVAKPPNPMKPVKPNPKTILVVDDEPKMAKRIAGYLREEGYHPVIATSGEQALTLARSEAPFAIVLDIIMPDMDGWEVLQSLKKNSKTQNIPVIIVSVSQDRETGFALGAIGYLTKPLSRNLLLSEIRKIGRPGIRSVMIVDDNEIDRREFRQIIETNGLIPIIAHDGAACLEMLINQIPDILILDLMMPEPDGFAVLETIRSNPKTRDLPVIVATAKDLTKEDRERLHNNVASVLDKSRVTPKTLLLEINRTLKDLENPLKSNFPENSASAPRILMVEDNEVAIIQIKSALTSSGYVVDVTTGGQEAIDYVSHTIPDGIVLDLMMPEIDGFEVLEKIRNKPATARIPVLILTAKDLTPEDFKRLSANNIQQLVHKGDVDREGLLLKIGSMIEGKQDATNLTKERFVSHRLSENPPPETILIMEDNPDNMATIKAILQNRYRLIQAMDGEKGLQMATENTPDLILLDMALPKMDGMTVVKHLKDNQKLCHIPVIALTARVMKGDREKILKAGCNDYISKPIDPTGFIEKITEWLKG